MVYQSCLSYNEINEPTFHFIDCLYCFLKISFHFISFCPGFPPPPCLHEVLGKVDGELGGVGKRKERDLPGGTICAGPWKRLVGSWAA